jgi:hypothetical protein
MTNIHKKEPLVLIGLAASGIVLLAGHFGIVLDHATVQTVLEPLVVSLLARPFVKPNVQKVVDDAEKVAEKVES